MRSFLLIISILGFGALTAQTTTFEVDPGDTTVPDTIKVVVHKEVEITTYMSGSQVAAYQRLKRNVRVAMPYAKLSAYKLRAMEDHLNTLKKRRDKKKYIKACEKNIKQLFTENLKNLTRDQGKILMKLIHRETGNTTWKIMKKYRGGIEAMFWQSFGALYGHNMKVEFDPVIDYQIDNIIRLEKLD